MKNLCIAISFFACFNFNVQAQQTVKGDIYYEIFVRSFSDSNKDGIGDINGITAKLGYLADLGITGIWLTPIHPSPTYHKYDIMDYTAIDPEYGTIDDFKRLVKEAHKRRIKIIMDFVVNHTSNRHPWFLQASGKPSFYKDFYSWSDTIKNTPNWHQNMLNPGLKYYGFFWEGMPDLNYDNQNVRNEIKSAGRFWLKEAGIDGFRIDAAQHIYDATEVSKNVAWWKEFKSDMLVVNPYGFFLGEVWNKDSVVAAYLGDALSACFNFDLSKELTNAIVKKNHSNLAEHLIHIRDMYKKSYPAFMDVTFISNHDQDRYRSTFGNDTTQTIQAFTVLMTLPGIPFLYYGEELGMTGKFPDHYRREPMMWADAFKTTWEKPVYSLPDSIMTAEEQLKRPNSFLSRYKNLISLRKSDPIFANGEMSACTVKQATDAGLLGYDIEYNKRKVTVIHNITGNTFQFDANGKCKFLNGGIKLKGKVVLPAGASVIIE